MQKLRMRTFSAASKYRGSYGNLRLWREYKSPPTIRFLYEIFLQSIYLLMDKQAFETWNSSSYINIQNDFNYGIITCDLYGG